MPKEVGAACFAGDIEHLLAPELTFLQAVKSRLMAATKLNR